MCGAAPLWACMAQTSDRQGVRDGWPLPAGLVLAALLVRRRRRRRRRRQAAQKAQLEMAVPPPEPSGRFLREPAWTSPPAVKMCDRTGGILESAVDLQDSAIKERAPNPKLPGPDTLPAAPEGDAAHCCQIGERAPQAGLPGPGSLCAARKAVQKQAMGA